MSGVAAHRRARAVNIVKPVLHGLVSGLVERTAAGAICGEGIFGITVAVAVVFDRREIVLVVDDIRRQDGDLLVHLHLGVDVDRADCIARRTLIDTHCSVDGIRALHKFGRLIVKGYIFITQLIGDIVSVARPRNRCNRSDKVKGAVFRIDRVWLFPSTQEVDGIFIGIIKAITICIQQGKLVRRSALHRLIEARGKGDGAVRILGNLPVLTGFLCRVARQGNIAIFVSRVAILVDRIRQIIVVNSCEIGRLGIAHNAVVTGIESVGINVEQLTVRNIAIRPSLDHACAV